MKETYFFGYLVTKFPDFNSIEELIEWEIKFVKEKDIKSFIRAICKIDLELPEIPEENLTEIKKADFCEITFEEIDGRMQRKQQFLYNIQIMSGLN